MGRRNKEETSANATTQPSAGETPPLTVRSSEFADRIMDMLVEQAEAGKMSAFSILERLGYLSSRKIGADEAGRNISHGTLLEMVELLLNSPELCGGRKISENVLEEDANDETGDHKVDILAAAALRGALLGAGADDAD